MTDREILRPFHLSVAAHFADMDNLIREHMSLLGVDEKIDVRVKAVPWDRYWTYLKGVSEKTEPGNLSEVGSTWVAHFINKRALRQLTPEDIASLGIPTRFLSSALQSVSLPDDKRIFAVPWLADTRVIYYWRDELKKANVDEKDAFGTPEKMETTLAAMKDGGKAPWGAPTFQVNNTLHQIASWIWSHGGDFLDRTGSRTTLLDKEALRGMCQYYELYRFMPDDFNSLDAVLDGFEEHEISVIINGSWYLTRLILGGASDDVLENLGVALPPGPPFVGGSHLVIWNDTAASDIDTTLSIINQLTSPATQREICRRTGLLSVCEGVLSEHPYATDPHYRVFAEALKQGKSLPSIPYWGSMEESLLGAFGNIWEEIKSCPDCDNIEEIVVTHIAPVAKRFDRLLRLV